MTIFSKNLGGDGPFGHPLATPMHGSLGQKGSQPLG